MEGYGHTDYIWKSCSRSQKFAPDPYREVFIPWSWIRCQKMKWPMTVFLSVFVMESVRHFGQHGQYIHRRFLFKSLAYNTKISWVGTGASIIWLQTQTREKLVSKWRNLVPSYWFTLSLHMWSPSVNWIFWIWPGHKHTGLQFNAFL